MRLKKQLFKKYVYEQKISMNKRQISLILSLKTCAFYWEAESNGTKLRNLFLIFKTPGLCASTYLVMCPYFYILILSIFLTVLREDDVQFLIKYDITYYLY